MLLAPDDRLPAGPARWTREAVSEAWQHERRRLREALADPAVRQVAILVGVPGSGKSTWARDHDQPSLVIFDACWTDPGKRRALAAQIRAAGKIPVAVWVRTPLPVCLERNAARPPDRLVPESVIKRAAVALLHDPPTVAEGWVHVLEVDGLAERIHDAAVPPEQQLERAARLPATTAWRLIRAKVLPELRRAQPGEGVPKAVERALATMERQLERSVDDRVAEAVGKIGQRIEARERGAFDQLVSREIDQDWAAPEADELVSDWAERQGNRLREIRAGIVPGVRAAIEEARRKGWSVAQLEQTWQAEGLPLDGYGTAEGRGKTLAAEAAAGLVQEATRAAQEAAGAEWYEWGPTSSANPDPEHAARRGQRFRWSDPPPDGHPGERYGCHCRAVPVLVLEDLERLRPAPPPPVLDPKPARARKTKPAAAAARPGAPVDVSRVKVQGWDDDVLATARDWWPELEHLSDDELQHEVLRTTGVEPQHLGRVTVEQGDGRISLRAKLKGGGTVERSLVSEFDYDEGRIKVTLVAEKFMIPTSEAARAKHGYPRGYGTQAFARLVDTAGRLGIDKIETEAAGTSDSDLNGYATWPALGYDGPILGVTYDVTARRAADKGHPPPPEFREGALVSDLYRTPEGRAWWRACGCNINLTFDPKPGSPQRAALDAYRKAKGL